MIWLVKSCLLDCRYYLLTKLEKMILIIKSDSKAPTLLPLKYYINILINICNILIMIIITLKLMDSSPPFELVIKESNLKDLDRLCWAIK